MLASLLAEITGALPQGDADVAGEIAPGKRVVLIFEDTLGALRVWQNELLKIDGDRLRAMNIAVACIPANSEDALLNGHPVTLPTPEIREALNKDGSFEVLLLAADGRILMRSPEPVTIETLSKAIALAEPPNAGQGGLR